MPPTRKSPSVPDGPILLHCCCGPCASACVERLLLENRPCRLYFSNSNIATREEFDLRLAQLEKVAAHFGLEAPLVDDYRHDLWRAHVAALPGYETAPERGPRCALCFGYSLGHAAQAAARLGLPFATSLTVSPHKPADLIAQVGAQFPNYEHWDFKKRDGFLRSIRLSQQLGLYRQAYCGCEFSWRNPQEACHGCQSDPES